MDSFLFPCSRRKLATFSQMRYEIISFFISISSLEELLSKAREKKDFTFDDDSKKKIKRSNDDDLNYLEMTLVADKYTISYHGHDTAKYLLMLVNLVS